MANDLDTPKCLALVWEHIKKLNKATLAETDKIFGLGFAGERPSAKLAIIKESELPEGVQKLLAEREEARVAKDFEKADTLRAEIEALGFVIKDTPEGPKISKS